MKLHRTELITDDLMHMGVTIINRENYLLQCNACGQDWTMLLDRSGRMPDNYWVCPNECNSARAVFTHQGSAGNRLQAR